MAVNPDVTVEVQQSDSTTGVTMRASRAPCDIGMASRDLKDSETGAGAEGTAIALDGIAVIVAPISLGERPDDPAGVRHLYRRGYQLGRRRLSGIDYAVPAEHAGSGRTAPCRARRDSGPCGRHRVPKRGPHALREGAARALFGTAAALSIAAVALICLFLLANGVPAMAVDPGCRNSSSAPRGGPAQ